jgi:hypothetical protein
MAMHNLKIIIYIYIPGADILVNTLVPKYLIRGGMSKGSVCKANTFICGIQNKVKALQEGLTVDEVKTRSAVATNITHNEVNGAGSSADQAVKRTRPELSIGSQFESSLYIYMCHKFYNYAGGFST